MKFLHTADIHLTEEHPDRIDIVRWIVTFANTQKVDGIIIAGDLFDSDEDATALRPTMRDVFDLATSNIFIIPGNHDARSYGAEYMYGERVIQCTDTPFSVHDLKGSCIVAVPYQKKTFSACVRNIPENTAILIAHGTLYDPSFIFSVIDDIETEYMPIFPQNLQDRARYVALGHLHSRSIELTYGGTHAVYPGSPLALDTKCSTPRSCSLVTLKDDSITIERIDVAIATYWQTKEFFVFPGNEGAIVEEIRGYLKTLDPEHIRPNILVHGFIGISEKEYTRTLDTISTHFKPMFKGFIMKTDFRSWDKMIEHRIVQRFIRKAEPLPEAVRVKLFEITFPILNKALK